MAVAPGLFADRRAGAARCLCQCGGAAQGRRAPGCGRAVQGHAGAAAGGRHRRRPQLPGGPAYPPRERHRGRLRTALGRSRHAGGAQLRRGRRGGRPRQARHAATDAVDDGRGHADARFGRAGRGQGAARRGYRYGRIERPDFPVAAGAECEPGAGGRPVRRHRAEPRLRRCRGGARQEPAARADRAGTDQPAGPGDARPAQAARADFALCQGAGQRRSEGGRRADPRRSGRVPAGVAATRQGEDLRRQRSSARRGEGGVRCAVRDVAADRRARRQGVSRDGDAVRAEDRADRPAGQPAVADRRGRTDRAEGHAGPVADRDRERCARRQLPRARQHGPARDQALVLRRVGPVPAERAGRALCPVGAGAGGPDRPVDHRAARRHRRVPRQAADDAGGVRSCDQRRDPLAVGQFRDVRRGAGRDAAE